MHIANGFWAIVELEKTANKYSDIFLSPINSSLCAQISMNIHRTIHKLVGCQNIYKFLKAMSETIQWQWLEKKQPAQGMNGGYKAFSRKLNNNQNQPKHVRFHSETIVNSKFTAQKMVLCVVLSVFCIPRRTRFNCFKMNGIGRTIFFSRALQFERRIHNRF